MSKLRQGLSALRRFSDAAAVNSRSVSTFTLPPLKYAYDALEPHIDEKTMTVHHTRHHQTYVSNLNGVLTGEHGDAIKGMSLAEIQKRVATLPEAIRTTVTNHGGGHYNHTLFFSVLAGETERAGGPVDDLRARVDDELGGVEGLRKAFDAAAMKVFGSGWAWLSVDADGKLAVSHTRNQENPLMQGVVEAPGTPILGLDVWEHAMYLKYLNRRPEYIAAFWHIVDWEQVSANYAAVRDGGTALFDVPMEE